MLAFFEELSQAVNVKYTFLSAVFLLVYDTVIHFSDEVDFIWLQRWSVGKVLYILTRYGGFVDASLAVLYSFSASLSIESCFVVYQIANWTITFGAHICQVVLILRTYAIWSKSKFVLIYLCVIELGALIASIILLYFSNKSVVFIPSPSPTLVSCVPIPKDNKLFIDYCLVLVVESNSLCLLLIKGFSQWKIGLTPLLRTLYRDGVVFFVVLFSASLVNVIFVEDKFNTPYFYIAVEHQRVFIAIFASHLIVNVRKTLSVQSVQYSVTPAGNATTSLHDRFADTLDFSTGVTVVED